MVGPVKQQRRRGRPQRDIIDVMFTQLWLGVIKARSGLASAGEIEEHLEPRLVQRRKDGVARVRKWDGYDAGRRVPQPASVAVAESRYPGTARYIDSPLRTLLRGDQVSLGWVRQQLLALPEPLVDLLWEPQGFTCTLPRLLRSFDDQRADDLVRLGGFWALEAAVLLMKWGELISSHELRCLARQTQIRIHPSLRATPELRPAIEAVLVAIDIKFPNWVFLRSDLRCEVLEFTYTRRGDAPIGACEIESAPALAHVVFDQNQEVLARRIAEPGSRPVLLSELLELLRAPPETS